MIRSESDRSYPIGAVRWVVRPSQTVINAKAKCRKAIDAHRSKLKEKKYEDR